MIVLSYDCHRVALPPMHFIIAGFKCRCIKTSQLSAGRSSSRETFKALAIAANTSPNLCACRLQLRKIGNANVDFLCQISLRQPAGIYATLLIASTPSRIAFTTSAGMSFSSPRAIAALALSKS